MINMYAVYNDVYNTLLNTTNKYITALTILVSFYILYKLFLFISKRVILKITEKTPTDLDKMVVESVEAPLSYILFMVGVKLALIPFELDNSVGFYASITVNSILIILVGFLVLRLASVLIHGFGKRWAKKTKSTLDDALIPVVDNFSKIVIVIFTFLYVFQSWNIDITSLLAGVGIAGLALGFAVKDSLANIFGGISIILDKAVKVGDRIEVEGISGIVHDVGIRSTKIKTWDNDIVVVPNGTLGNAIIKNFQLPSNKSRVIIEFGVEYGVKHEKVRMVALGVLKGIEHIIDDPAPLCRFQSMGDSALNFKLFFWCDDIANTFAAKEIVTSKLYDSLNKAKIGIPFPQMSVHIKKK